MNQCNLLLNQHYLDIDSEKYTSILENDSLTEKNLTSIAYYVDQNEQLQSYNGQNVDKCENYLAANRRRLKRRASAPKQPVK